MFFNKVYNWFKEIWEDKSDYQKREAKIGMVVLGLKKHERRKSNKKHK